MSTNCEAARLLPHEMADFDLVDDFYGQAILNNQCTFNKAQTVKYAVN